MRMFLLFFITFILVACTKGNSEPSRVIYDQSFHGITITNEEDEFEYNFLDAISFSMEKETIDFESCEGVGEFDASKLLDFDFYRFRLFFATCMALDWYESSDKSNRSSFSDPITISQVSSFPANVLPFLSESEHAERQGLSISEYGSSKELSEPVQNRFKLLLEDSEYFVTLLARADFDRDGVEDVLLRSEWYSQNSFGKHVDLVILSKSNEQSKAYILKRLNSMD